MVDAKNDQSRINNSLILLKSATESWGGTTFVRPTYPFLNWIPLDESEKDVSSPIHKLKEEKLSNKTADSGVAIQQSNQTENEKANLLLHAGNLAQSENHSSYNKDGELNKTSFPPLDDKNVTTEKTDEFARNPGIESLYIRSDAWQAHKIPQTHASFSEATLDKIRTSQPCTNFRTFIIKSVTNGDACYPINDEGKLVMAFVEKVVNDLHTFLDEQFRMFKGCKILKTGSVYEKTKIGKPDEFDFMIEVPALSGDGPILFSLFPQEDDAGLVSCDIVNTAFFEDICTHPLSEFNPMQEGTCKGSDKTMGLDFLTAPIVKILLIRISRIIRNKLSELLPPEERYQGLHLQPMVEKAMTYTLLWRGDVFPWLPVSIDFVLGIPLQKTDNLDIPVNKSLHAIFHNHASRISCSLSEMAIFQQFTLEDGQNKCMRLLKHLKERYTPKEWEFSTSIFEVRKYATLPTYWLKNTMFYMYRKYNGIPDAFSEKELPFRVVETLEIFLECCRRRVLHSFFVPHCNLISTEGDEQETKEKQLKCIVECIEEVLRNIKCMEENEQALEELHELVTRRDQPTKESQNNLIFRHLIKELGQYAARGYKQDELDRLKACCVYVNDFSGCEFSITGNSEDISFTNRGRKVDIVEEMIKLQNESMEEKRQQQKKQRNKTTDK